MKKLICLLPLLFLTGCSRPAWETVCDTIPSVAALAQDSCAYSISLGMPQELQLAEQDGRTAIYSTAQGEMEVRTETFFASSSETAISYLTAMEPDALTVLQTERFDLPEYQFVWLSATEKGRLAFRKWMDRSGFLGKTAEKIACSRVAEGLSLCMFSGLDLDQSLEMTEKLITQETMKKRIDQCRSMMADGEGFDQALMKSGIFSGLYGKMISVGIRTGSVDQVMSKIAGEYGEAVVQSLEQKVAVVEPTLVAVLSVLVGLVLISVMLPLMNIMSNLG